MASLTIPAEKRRITIDPVTRLEGHGKIEIFLNDEGTVERAYFQVPELRGFEKFAQGRPAERHAADHVAHLRRLPDGASHGVHQGARQPLPGDTAGRRRARSASWSTAPSWWKTTRCTSTFWAVRISWSDRKAPAAERNVLGVIGKVGVETGMKVIAMRRKLRDLIALAAGKAIHPVFGVPGGVSKPLSREDAAQFRDGGGRGRGIRQVHLRIFSRRWCLATPSTWT